MIEFLQELAWAAAWVGVGILILLAILFKMADHYDHSAVARVLSFLVLGLLAVASGALLMLGKS
jgi:hypothetical protein